MVHSLPRAYVLVGVLLAMVSAGAVWVYLYFFDFYHYREVVPGVLYRDGFRSMREFNNAVLASRAKTVISLLDESEYGRYPYNEQWEYLTRAKVRLNVISIKLGGFPTTADVRRFLEEVEKPHRQPVLVHCAQGIRRTGMMVAAYQMSVMGWDKERTKAAIESFGHSQRTINDIKRFIDAYDPVNREVTEELTGGYEGG